MLEGVGFFDGCDVGFNDGFLVGRDVVGLLVGAREGLREGRLVVGFVDGFFVGLRVRFFFAAAKARRSSSVGDLVGAIVGEAEVLVYLRNTPAQ